MDSFQLEEERLGCDYTFRANGNIDMFVKYNDPQERGDVVGFQQRFTAGPITGKYIGTIHEASAE